MNEYYSAHRMYMRHQRADECVGQHGTRKCHLVINLCQSFLLWVSQFLSIFVTLALSLAILAIPLTLCY